MTERARLAGVAAGLALAAAAGLGIEAMAPPLEASPIPGAAAPYVGRSVFCPSAPRAADAVTRIAATVDGADPFPLRVSPGGVSRRISGEGLLLTHTDETLPTVVSAFGAEPAATTLQAFAGRFEGAGATSCSGRASRTWFFPEGSSSLRADERLLIFNPFPEEAVVRVTFFTATGPRSKANLADVAVPSGRAVEIAVNEFIFRQPLLAAGVVAQRGRVVAWRTLLAPRRNDAGVRSSLGAPAPASSWYFPEGGVGPGFDERITVLNPGSQEAVVTIGLATATRVVQLPRLVELTVPPGSARRVVVAPSGGEPRSATAVSVVVTSTTGTEIVAERSVAYSARGLVGAATEVGAARPGPRWFLGRVARHARADAVVLMNPGSQDARVRVTLAAGDRVLAPRALRRIRVPAGLRLSVSLDRWTRGRALGAFVTSDVALVAERRAYSRADSDVATAMGVMLRPSELER